MPRKFFKRAKSRPPVQPETSTWQKVIAFAGIGRLGVAIVRLWREWKNGEGPSAFL